VPAAKCWNRGRQVCCLEPFGAFRISLAPLFDAVRRKPSGRGLVAPSRALQPWFRKRILQAEIPLPACPLSHWKNEGKIRFSRPVKGGLKASMRYMIPDQKLTGFPLV